MAVYIGVDLGGTNMRAGRVENDRLVAQANERTPKAPKDTAETIAVLERVIGAVWSSEVAAIGIGVPGLVDREKGIVYNLVHIPHWDVVPLGDILRERFSVPVFIDNDANCFALGERVFGVGRSYEHFVGLTLGTGLGGGIVQQGRLLADAIMHERALAGDPEALEAYRQLGEHVAAAVKIVMLAVDPEMIVFGGSVAAAHSLFEASMWASLQDFAYPNSLKRLRIFFSELENPAIFGAASLCY